MEGNKVLRVLDSIIKKAGEDKNPEARVIINEQTSLEYEKNRLKNPEHSRSTLLIIRLTMSDGRFGIATTNQLSNWKKLVKECEKMARVNEPDSDFKSLPAIKKQGREHYGKKLEKYSEEDLIQNVQETVENLEVKVQSMSANKNHSKKWFANPHAIQEARTTNHLSFSINVKKKGVTAWESHESTEWFSFKKWGLKAQELCLKSVNPSPASTGVQDVILDYSALQSIVSNTLVPAINVENVQKGRSPYAGMLGEEVCSKKISITDDWRYEGGLYHNLTDGEGVKTSETKVIKGGVLKNFLYDHYSAQKESRKTTGNCGGILSRPNITTSNLVMKPGSWKKEELLEDTRGVLVSRVLGAHMINPLSGDFSVQAENAFSVDKGVLKPLKGVMISGNVFKMLQRLNALCKETRQENSLVAPLTRFKDVQVIG